MSVNELCGRDPTFRLAVAIIFSRAVECGIVALAVVACFELDVRKFFFFLAIMANVGVSLILKNVLRQSRPDGSCLASYGMPSSHAQIAHFAATIVIFFLVRKFIGGGGHHSFREYATLVYRCSVTVLLAWFVAESRVVLGHHTLAQVVVGSVIGIALAGALLTPYIIQLRKKLARHPQRNTLRH